MKHITVETIVNAPVEKVWTAWTEPAHITKWAFASDDWEAPYAENDVTVGGKFLTKMAPKNSTEGFDFTGTYTAVTPHQLIEYTMDDGRKVSVQFQDLDGKTKVIETFEMENENPEEVQRGGWQAILDNFKKHAESM